MAYKLAKPPGCNGAALAGRRDGLVRGIAA